MGAKSDLSVKRNGAYAFEMPEAIPPYLIALAVGDLKFQQTGPRTGVYAQKYILKQAAKEFADVESMIQAGEKLFGPYRWERYDILVLPPTFPEGGMENPRLSFITPTVITGDKSLVSLIAHELAHSWSGNLVGNATWRDVWLNEGFSDYLESRIVNAVYGERREMMDRVLGIEVAAGEPRAPEACRPGAGDRSARPRPGGGFLRGPVREGTLVPHLSRCQVRARAIRCVPARLLRSLRVQEHRHRGLPAIPEGEPARPLSGGRDPGSGDWPGSMAPASRRMPCSRRRTPSLRSMPRVRPGWRAARRRRPRRREAGSRSSGCISSRVCRQRSVRRKWRISTGASNSPRPTTR